MRKAYIIANFVWLALAAAVCAESLRLNVGSFHAPGPAFLPFFAAGLLGVLSLISLVQTWREKEEQETEPLGWNTFREIGSFIGRSFSLYGPPPGIRVYFGNFLASSLPFSRSRTRGLENGLHRHCIDNGRDLSSLRCSDRKYLAQRFFGILTRMNY